MEGLVGYEEVFLYACIVLDTEGDTIMKMFDLGPIDSFSGKMWGNQQQLRVILPLPDGGMSERVAAKTATSTSPDGLRLSIYRLLPT